MPSIEHIALWTPDLERLRTFYETHFAAESGPRYENEKKRFTSYFLTFGSGPRLEIMHTPAVATPPAATDHQPRGYTHIAFSVGSEQAVDELTERLRREGVPIAGNPRHTGDGCYESVALDPDGNRIEITV